MLASIEKLFEIMRAPTQSNTRHQSMKVRTKFNLLQSRRPLNLAIFSGKFETNSNFSIGYQEYQERRKLRPRTLSKLSWTTEERNKFVDVINGRLKLLKGSPEREKYVDQLLALTPSQFVRLDREEQKRKAACALSLTTLYLNVKEKRFSDAELLKQIEAAKEDCQCSIYAHEIMNYCKAENITDSLIDLLQEFIDNTGPDNPPPLNGELTSLLYDAGDLSTHPPIESEIDLDFRIWVKN